MFLGRGWDGDRDGGVVVLFVCFSPSLIAAFVFIGMEKYSSGRCSPQKTCIHSKRALGTDLSNKDFMKKLDKPNRTGVSQGTPKTEAYM